MRKLTLNNKEKILQNLHSRHETQGFLKNRKTEYSDFREVPPWWVPHWVKFRIFSSLGRWKQHFRDEITKYFYCDRKCNVKLNYVILIAINRNIQPLLLNINKWNLKVLISDLLFFVFQFHIRLSKYGFGNTLYSPPKIKVSSKFIFWATKSFFGTLRKHQIRKLFGPKIFVYLV